MPAFGLGKGYALFSLFLALYFATALKTTPEHLQLPTAPSASIVEASAHSRCPQHCLHVQVTRRAPQGLISARAGGAEPMP